MKKNIALLLGLSLGLTAVGCALPAAETRAETSKELIVSETPTGSGETDTTGTEAVTMFRLYNPNSGEHFYTKDESEKAGLVKEGWNDEGIGWIAPVTSKTPVYRLYNANAGDHHYTLKEEEKDNLISAGWNFEGIGWYSDDEKTVPLYREYNPNAVTGTHNYTKDKVEHDGLVKAGWRDEGIGWYGIEENKDDPPKKPDDDSLEIGDIVILGTYEQDNDLTNGPEPIEWQYIGDRDGRKFLLSKYVLDCRQYNVVGDDITWEDCTLRKWLNEDFYNVAFSASDKGKIVKAHNENLDSWEIYEGVVDPDEPDVIWGADGGNDTDDNVFLMSWEEAAGYLDGKMGDPNHDNYNAKLLGFPTVYAKERGLRMDKDRCYWWLRSPGSTQWCAANVVPWGALGGSWVDINNYGVRPAILIY